MKFKKLRMKNFMRYKGVNDIEFSCDNLHNVTIVLGDNTVGKTTLAQAFRWCLYGMLMTEKDKKESDYTLLNNDIVAAMDGNSRANVFVELLMEDDEKSYLIHRETQYARIYPQFMLRECDHIVRMYTADVDSPEVRTEINGQLAITQLINELLPMNLSHYFLFDGERWSDVTIKGVRENIKSSVHILTGLTSYQKAMFHLKEMGSNSVIKNYKNNIKGDGSVYDNLSKEKEQLEHNIYKMENEVESYQKSVKRLQEDVQKLEIYLEKNRDTQVMQVEHKQLLMLKRNQESRYLAAYKTLINDVSSKEYMIFAKPMIDAAVKMVKSVAGERRDIPHMRQSSIDSIIKSGKCICGAPIIEGEDVWQHLMEQRNYLPPADMGSLLGEFEKTGNRWKRTECDIISEIDDYDGSLKDYDSTVNEIAKLEKNMSMVNDYKEKHDEMMRHKREISDYSVKCGELKGRISDSKSRIKSMEGLMQAREAATKENAIWRRRLEIAEAVYDRMEKDFKQKENKIFLELNEEIQKNFSKMFNAKDKRMQLSENYEIQLCYKNGIGYREEKNLSEGEKVARNFAFIVTMMEYSKRKKNEQSIGDVKSDTIPIVLDGPFSKLGEENIGLVANVLPKVSEQVIVFMLKKDWEYTGLDEYVGAEYYIDKPADRTYAEIKKVRG